MLARLQPDWGNVQWGRFLDGGYANLNFQLSHEGAVFVLRVPPSDQARDGLLPAALLQAVVAACNEPVSMDVETEVVSTPCVVAYEELTGAQLSEWEPLPLLADADEASFVPERFGRLLASLHTRLAPLHPALAAASRRDQTLDDLLDGLGVAPHRRAGIPAPAGEPVPGHGDLNPWNLLTDGTRWSVIDWESVALIDPVFDMATLIEGLRGLRWRITDDFVARVRRAYADAGGIQIPADRYADAVLRFEWREWAWAVAALRDGNRRSEIAAQRDRYAQRLSARGVVLPGA